MNKTVMILLAVNAVVMLGAGAGIGYFVLQPDSAEAADEEVVEEPAVAPGLIELEPFLTNIDGGQGAHKARLQVKLAIAPLERADEISSDALVMARMRDRILSLISSKGYDELSAPDGKTMLRDAIQTEVASVLEGDDVREVLFADFVVQ